MWEMQNVDNKRGIQSSESETDQNKILYCTDNTSVRGVSWSEVATVPKRKSHRGLDLNLSWNSEKNIWKGWKKSGGTK